MKKILALILSFLLSFCSVGCGLYRSSVLTRVCDSIFDKKMLDYYDIPWLTKPENVSDEENDIRKNYCSYTAKISSVEEYKAYATEVYNNLQTEKYTSARLKERIATSGFMGIAVDYYYITERLSSFEEDFSIDEGTDYDLVSIYYTTKPLKEYESQYGYLMEKAIDICVIFFVRDGECRIGITLEEIERVYIAE